MVRMLPHRLKSNGLSQPNSRSASPMRAPNQTLVLRTTVVKGRNLAAKDKNGTSDPYLVVSLGDTRQSTPTINKTLNPEWQVTFDSPILGPHCALLHAICWDKDRFGKDYMGEVEILLDDVFHDGNIVQEPKWYTLKSKRTGKKKSSTVSGDIELQFALVDTAHPEAPAQDIVTKLHSVIALSAEDEKHEDVDLARPTKDGAFDTGEEDEEDEDEDLSDELFDDPNKPETPERRRRRLRIKRLKRKTKARAYELFGSGDVVGIIYLEIGRVTDLPPERNVTRTGFDMDPFVIASLGRKTYRTRVIRHNLNPVFDEKLVFQVLRHEQQYSINFSVVDRDKLSGNDFVANADFEISTLIENAPEADPETGLYQLREISEPSTPVPSKSRFRLPLSRATSSQSLMGMGRPALQRDNSQASLNSANGGVLENAPTSTSMPVPDPNALAPAISNSKHLEVIGDEKAATHDDDPEFRTYTIPLTLKNKDKWGDKYHSQLYIRARYMPYRALRQQFWRALLKQYDADESRKISKLELTTMLDTLGSTLKESTIDEFFARFGHTDSSNAELTFDEVTLCLEDQLQDNPRRHGSESVISRLSRTTTSDSLTHATSHSSRTTEVIAVSDSPSIVTTAATEIPENDDPTAIAVPAIDTKIRGPRGEKGKDLGEDDLVDDRGVEHVIEIRECPICHQPRLNKRSDADIITHIATCASQDWKQVNNLVMAGFVTASQAQRKWYSKIVTKIGYGGYRLGANSANILVQDRRTGQINEERMSVYVRLGIRLLYKGLGSRDMEKKRIRKLLRSLSFKQGRKFDDPASASQIQGFINFHQLDMSEVRLPLDQFKNFNEFFYRELKLDARPCSAPNNPKIIVSPADCRSVVFNTIDEATKIWIKGREFSVERLIGSAYPQDAKRYKGGALGVFRLAPQDYHRFHIPVDGVVDEPKLIEGEYYTVNPMAIRSALDVYGENIRVIVPIDSVTHGRVMVVCIGAMMVGSTVITRKKGEHVKRAEELGYFKFGGSTLVVLFEPGQMQFDSDLADNSSGALETLIRVGTSIGHSPDQDQHTPDMQKRPENVTIEERQEAKRRIEGSLAPVAESTLPPIESVTGGQ